MHAADLSTTPVHVTASGVSHFAVGPREMAGIFPEVIRRLERELNFTAEYYKREDRNYGHRLANGTYTGAIKSLLDVRWAK